MNIDISKIIVHKLNIGGDKPILSDKCLDLDGIDDIDEALSYFKTHILNSKKQSFMRQCQFDDLEDNTVLNDIREVIEKIELPNEFENMFIEKSKKITRKLFNSMKTTSSKSDGSLFILFYSLDGKNYIGIMKMDPNTGVEINDDLSIKVRKSMLPSINEKLHKLAFILIKKEYKENEFHLNVLDRQNKSGESAKYFMQIFLNSRELSNEMILTKEIEREIVNGFQELIPRKNWPMFADEFQKLLMKNEEINFEEDIPRVVRPFLDDDSKDMDFSFQTKSISANILKKYPDAVMRFIPKVDIKKPIIYQSKHKEIEIRIAKPMEKDKIQIDFDKKTGDFLIRVKRELNVKNTKL